MQFMYRRKYKYDYIVVENYLHEIFRDDWTNVTIK